MATRTELSDFLIDVERRALRQALFAVRDEEHALDIVQDAMLKLSEHYGDRPANELPMLFQRILQNTIRDFYRRQKVRSLWTTLLSALTPGSNGNGNNDHDDEHDPLDTMIVENNPIPRPETQLEQSQVIAIIEKEIEKLPPRQREAFLMRYWEDMDIATTADAMGCTEGSVKTHCSRATHTLATALRLKGIEP
ncbi:MAG: RNA polymerase sigma factor [Sterolibacterium sp.]|nr:RNA polymerase sigma factor [Sterolibacterium sp.]MBP9800033.1 RNA polymerase sigma factor [Sterolibacterium sp.]